MLENSIQIPSNSSIVIMYDFYIDRIIGIVQQSKNKDSIDVDIITINEKVNLTKQ